MFILGIFGGRLPEVSGLDARLHTSLLKSALVDTSCVLRNSSCSAAEKQGASDLAPVEF